MGGRLVIARPFLLGAFAVSLTDCRSAEALPPWLEEPVARLDRRFTAIDATDGIGVGEAQELANLYRAEYINGCGAALEPELSDDVWTAELLLGFTVKRSDRRVQVDARTGGVWSADGPRYPDIAAFRRGLLDDFVRKRR